MSEPLARARRVVAVGAAALAVVIVALAAAAWRLVDEERGDADVRGRAAAALAVDDLIRTLASTIDPPAPVAAVLSDDGAILVPVPPRRFKPSPPFGDPEGAFLIRESESWSPSLRRAALRKAVASSDWPTSARAKAEEIRLDLREHGDLSAYPLTHPSNGFRSDEYWSFADLTRDEVFVWVATLRAFAVTSDSQIVVGGRAMPALPMIGGADDVEAAAIIVGLCPDGAARIRARRAELQEARLLAAAWKDARDVGGAARAAMLGDGTAVVAQRNLALVGRQTEMAWRVVRKSAAEVRDAAERVLRPRGLKLVPGHEATTTAVPFSADGSWSIDASFAASEVRSRSTLLVVGLGVAAGAAVLAFVAFARSARREARLAALRTDFVATVSHELRTPVAVVRTSAETLASGRATRDADRQALTEAIVRESERLSSLVGNVLDFARMESGRRTYAKRPTDLGALVRDVASRNAGVTVEIAADVPSIACDRDALGGAVGNLLDNARKYSSPEAPIAARVACRGGDVVVEVEDHGIGVPDAEKPHVFERFFRGADPRVRDTRGAGIGLALVEHAAHAHGGRVEIDDTPGGGATFRITLPIAQNR